MRPKFAAIGVLVLVGCGGSHPAGPTARTATGVVFYDENGNGRLDDDEAVRLPGVTVTAGGASATTQAGGTFALASATTVTVQAASLPPFFVPGPAQSTGSEWRLPVTLPIGANRPDVYMGFGDSITEAGGGGYLPVLQARLASFWGRAEVINEGLGGTRSDQGKLRLGAALARDHPAFVLIHYGTNDYDHGCR